MNAFNETPETQSYKYTVVVSTWIERLILRRYLRSRLSPPIPLPLPFPEKLWSLIIHQRNRFDIRFYTSGNLELQSTDTRVPETNPIPPCKSLCSLNTFSESFRIPDVHVVWKPYRPICVRIRTYVYSFHSIFENNFDWTVIFPCF
jgi:hypothetical protein